jgi:hypothetical protein
MKKMKILTSALCLSLAITFYMVPILDSNGFGIVYDKEAIDCGAYFGTRCVGNGDGCDPRPCDPPQQ